jgi:integrase/recombinase XerD
MPIPQPTLKFYSPQDDLRNPALPLCLPVPPDIRWFPVQDFFRAHNFRPNTIKAYQRELQRFLAWTDQSWIEISPRDFANYKHHLEQQGLAIASVARALAPLKSLFKWLTVSGYVAQNPTLQTNLPTPPRPLPQHFSAEEIEVLYNALADRGATALRDRAILTVLEFGGLRLSEVSALNLEDWVIDDADPTFPGWGSITVRAAKDDSTGSIPLPPDAVTVLQTYLEERRHQGEDLSAPSTPLFLAQSLNPKRRGTRLGPSGIYALLQDLGQMAGVPHCHPHRFRHTFATRLVLMGMDSYLGRKLTRHRSERAYQRYSEYGRQIAAEQDYKSRFQAQQRMSLGAYPWTYP